MASRWRRWGRRVGRTLAVVAALALVALVVIVRSLDQPWLKRRLVAMAHERTGLDVDWTATHVALFSGLRVDELVVRTPPALRATAPELVRLEGIDVTWTARSLIAGTPRFGALRVARLDLTLVRDAGGRTSLSTIEPHGDGKPPPPEVPPSRLAADALDGPPPIGRIDVGAATVTVLAEPVGGPRERLRVDGIALHATLARAGRGFALAAALGTPEQPLALQIERTRDGAAAGEARARMVASLSASPTEATARVDLEVLSQTLAPGTPVKQVAHLEADARFGDGRVNVRVARTRLGDGAATADAEVELPDGGAPRIAHADGELDLPRLLALVPASLVPVEAERARLRYHVEGQSARVEGELGRVRVGGVGGPIVADGGKILVTARPEGSATVVHAVVPLATLSLPGVAAERVHVTVDGRLAADGAISGEATVRYGGVRYGEAKKKGGGPRIGASDGELAVKAEALRVDPKVPLASRGELTLSARAAMLDAVDAASHVIADGLTVGARMKLTGAPPYAIAVDAPVTRLRLSSGPGRPLVDAPLHLVVQASDLRPDATRLRRSTGVVAADVTLGAVHTVVDATKWADAVDYKLHADASSLAIVAPLVAHAAWQAPWDKMSLTVVSDGRVEHLAAAPSLREHTVLGLAHGAWKGPNGSVAADRLELDATSNGNAAKHELTAALRTRALRVDGAPQGDAALSAKATFDVRAPKAHLVVATSGDAGPKLALDAALGFDRARRAVTWDTDVSVSRLASLEPLTHGGISGFDWETLAVALKGGGSFAGLVREVDPHGGVRFVDDPLKTLAADGTFDLAVDGLDWSRGDREVAAPHARWHAILATAGTRRLVHGTLTVDALELSLGDHEIVLRDVRDDIDGAIEGDLRAGIASLDHRLAIKRISQDLLTPYRMGDVSLNIRANRDGDGVVHIAEVALGNRVGGTTLSLRGGLDAGAERRSLSLRGEITQDLSRFWAVPGQLQGRGQASVQLRLDSGNLRVFHALAAVRISGATIELPRANVKIESMDGEIPITADLVADADGMHLLRSSGINAYSELRFADQHPLLSRPSFVSIARVTTPLISVAPLAGNLRVDDNIVSLNQLELGVRGGRVTGQCILDWRGGSDAKVQMRVRGSDVKSSHGEPFDGNAAIDVSTRDRSVDGRAEILRIGRRHLLDLLDLHDPHHGDAAVNRVRRALALGYPDHVRLTFKHGFADAKIEFGGLARLVRVDELRGIPMGPLIDRIMAPLEHKQEDEEP